MVNSRRQTAMFLFRNPQSEIHNGLCHCDERSEEAISQFMLQRGTPIYPVSSSSMALIAA